MDSSVEIQDSYFDERFLLRRALRASIRASGFHTCFGPRLALRASIEVRGEFWTSSFKVFDCFGLRLQVWALLRASGFPARFGSCHSIGWAAPAPRAGASTGCGRAPEPGADGQPPAAALPGQLRCQWILLYLFICTVAKVILNFGNGRCSKALNWSAEATCWAEAEFRVNQTIITIFESLLHHYYLFTNNGSVIAYLCIIVTSLLRINMPVIKSLLTIIMVITDNYYMFLQ